MPVEERPLYSFWLPYKRYKWGSLSKVVCLIVCLVVCLIACLLSCLLNCLLNCLLGYSGYFGLVIRSRGRSQAWITGLSKACITGLSKAYITGELYIDLYIVSLFIDFYK